MVVYAHDLDLDSRSDWDLSDIPPYGVIDTIPSIQAELTAIRIKCVEPSVQAPKDACWCFQGSPTWLEHPWVETGVTVDCRLRAPGVSAVCGTGTVALTSNIVALCGARAYQLRGGRA